VNYMPHIRAAILKQRGGTQTWKVLESVVEGMNEEQRQAFFRLLKNTEEEGVDEGRRIARRQPWRYMGG